VVTIVVYHFGNSPSQISVENRAAIESGTLHERWFIELFLEVGKFSLCLAILPKYVRCSEESDSFGQQILPIFTSVTVLA
jgi:hypothetical protein